jgi:hypothetical protein
VLDKAYTFYVGNSSKDAMKRKVKVAFKDAG